MRRLLATVVFVCVSPAFVLATGPRRGPAIPSWFWGCWRIVRAMDVNAASPLHFTGRHHKAEAGLEHLAARNYTSTWGRLMTLDWSAGAAAVPHANFSDPQTLNSYADVAGNPVAIADASGHACGRGANGKGSAKTEAGRSWPCAQSGNKGPAEEEQLVAALRLNAKGAAMMQALVGGFHATPYRDSAGYLTVGFGHKTSPGEHLPEAMTLAQGETLFRSDVKWAEAAVRHGLGAFLVKQNQYDALVDLAFSAGPSAVAPGHELMLAVHAGRITAHNFKEYSMGHIPGERGLHKIPGLLHRHEADWILYSKGIY